MCPVWRRRGQTKILTALQINQIAGLVTLSSWKIIDKYMLFARGRSLWKYIFTWARSWVRRKTLMFLILESDLRLQQRDIYAQVENLCKTNLPPDLFCTDFVPIYPAYILGLYIPYPIYLIIKINNFHTLCPGISVHNVPYLIIFTPKYPVSCIYHWITREPENPWERSWRVHIICRRDKRPVWSLIKRSYLKLRVKS